MIDAYPWKAEVMRVRQGDLLVRPCVSRIVIRTEAVELVVVQTEEAGTDRTSFRQIFERYETTRKSKMFTATRKRKARLLENDLTMSTKSNSHQVGVMTSNPPMRSVVARSVVKVQYIGMCTVCLAWVSF